MTMAKMPVNIRSLDVADQAEWRVLWTDYLAFYKTTLPEDVFVNTFQRLCDPNCPDLNALVAELDGRLVGLTHYIFHRHCWRTQDVCYLQDLFVTPDLRGTGSGRGLIEAVYKAADAAGAPTVYWLTQEDNTTGRQLYDRVGSLTNFIKYQRSTA